jgi:hypothetical protein
VQQMPGRDAYLDGLLDARHRGATRQFHPRRRLAKKRPTSASSARCIGATEVKGFPHPTRTILSVTYRFPHIADRLNAATPGA